MKIKLTIIAFLLGLFGLNSGSTSNLTNLVASNFYANQDINLTAYADDQNTPPNPYKNIFKPKDLPGPSVSKQNGEDTIYATTDEVQTYISDTILPKVAIRLTSYAIILCFLALLYSGFLYISALDSTDNYDKAKRVAVYSIIGLVISFTSYGIIQLVFSIPIFE
jgi:hypothetical protein